MVPAATNSVTHLLNIIERGNSADLEPAARALKHLARADPAAFAKDHAAVFAAARETSDLRTRWNLIVVLGLLPLSPARRAAVTDWLFKRLQDPSPFTRVFALESLVTLRTALRRSAAACGRSSRRSQRTARLP